MVVVTLLTLLISNNFSQMLDCCKFSQFDYDLSCLVSGREYFLLLP